MLDHQCEDKEEEDKVRVRDSARTPGYNDGEFERREARGGGVGKRLGFVRQSGAHSMSEREGGRHTRKIREQKTTDVCVYCEQTETMRDDAHSFSPSSLT